MKVSEQDADLFFDLMFPLQQYVNGKLRAFPEIRSLEAYRKSSYEIKLEVRDALYENIGLIDEYVRENPQAHPKEHLSIVKEWKRFVRGEFYIERFLKKYAIFISSDNRVFAVLALHDGFDEMVDKGALPFMVKAVLLPFKGRIIFDGLLEGYTTIYFGSGIKGDLREVYMAAKENGYIIDRLDEGPKGEDRSTMISKDWHKELARLEKAAAPLKGGSNHPPILNRAFKLIKASIEFAKQAASDPSELSDLWAELEKVNRALNGVEDTLHRAGRYHG